MSAATPVIAAAVRSGRWAVWPTAVAAGGMVVMGRAVMVVPPPRSGLDGVLGDNRPLRGLHGGCRRATRAYTPARRPARDRTDGPTRRSDGVRVSRLRGGQRCAQAG